MRKFYLKNETGAEVPLNGEEKIFFSDPSGLGVSYSSSYADIGSGFFKNTEKKYQQGTIPGTLTFMRTAYEKYLEFINWIEAAQELYLIYRPQTTEYWRRVELSYLTKTELTAGTWMQVPAEFICLTPWYIPSPLNLAFESEPDNVMTYDYTYDDNLIYGSGSAGEYSAAITAKGHVPAALLVEYTGVAVDPVISLTGIVSGKVYGECRISGELEATDKLVLSTEYRDSYIKKISADGTETDLLDAIDITAEPFFRVPLEEPCELSFTADSILSGTAAAQAFFYYGSV